MEILLVVVVIAPMVAIGVGSVRRYQEELRRNLQSNAGAPDDSFLFTFGESGAGPSSHGYGGINCGDSHHAGCDVGHGGFDGGHGGFDGSGGHH